MKRWILCFFFSLVIIGTASADFKKKIECTHGNYEGWEVWYEKEGFEGTAIFHFENKTGVTAFNVRVFVTFFDSTGKYLWRIKAESEGPIHSYIEFRRIFPNRARKLTCEIYWTDKWEKSE